MVNDQDFAKLTRGLDKGGLNKGGLNKGGLNKGGLNKGGLNKGGTGQLRIRCFVKSIFSFKNLNRTSYAH